MNTPARMTEKKQFLTKYLRYRNIEAEITWYLSCMFFHLSGSNTEESTKLYNSPKWYKFLFHYFGFFIAVDWTEISHMNKEQHAFVPVTEH